MKKQMKKKIKKLTKKIELKIPEKINWICYECAIKLGGHPSKSRAVCSWCATYHVDVCDVCKETKNVTEPRDFGL